MFCGWLGEFPFFISVLRVLLDTIRAGYLRSYPIPVFSSEWYGFSWRVSFWIGDLDPYGFYLIGVGSSCLILLFWVFIEMLKYRAKSGRM